MIHYTPEALSRAVAELCPDICARIEASTVSDEQHLWWELSCCILSSQVPFPLAMAAADVIAKHGYLHIVERRPSELEDRLIDILSAPINVEGTFRNYRFPKARANQLAATRAAITRTSGSLGALIKTLDVNELRRWLVSYAPGVGPKQASMFLRNCGITYDLAILDRHVLSYMSIQGLYSGRQTSISALSQYDRHERSLRNHAKTMGYPVGFLDWAIWIVMRVANRNPVEGV